MEVLPPLTGPSTSLTPGADSAPLSSDFEDFIQLLTTQAKYQDPLEPTDSTEFVSQLAQFSMVEQQVLTNDLMALQYEQVATTTMAALAGWVGMEARVATPMYFSGSPITISPNPVALADEVRLVVRDEEGVEVQSVALPVSADPYDWQGIDSETGAVLPDGTYAFEVQSYINGELVLAETAEVYGRITEAQSVGGDTVLILEGETPVLSTSVTAIREP